MLVSLDLLVIVFMAIAGFSLLAGSLMFLIKNRIARKVCFYVVLTISFYITGVALFIFWPMFAGQAAIALFLGLAGVAALVLELTLGKNKWVFLAVRIAAITTLLLGILNAFS